MRATIDRHQFTSLQERELADYRDGALLPRLRSLPRREIERLAEYICRHWVRVYCHARGWPTPAATVDYLAALERPRDWPSAVADLARHRRDLLDAAAIEAGRKPYRPARNMD